MDIERQLDDLGVDAITGVQLMRMLNLNGYELTDGRKFSQFKDIIDYFKHRPTSEYLINKLTIGKNVDKVEHIWGYVELEKQKEKYNNEISKLKNNIDEVSALQETDPEKIVSLLKRMDFDIADFTEKISKVDEQLDEYGK